MWLICLSTAVLLRLEVRGRESWGQRGDSRLTCFHWLRSEVSADCGSPIKLFPHLDACHCENPFNGLSHARLQCPKSLKRRSGVFSVREGRTGTFSKSLRPRCCYCCRMFFFLFLACWRRQRSHGKASSSDLSRGRGGRAGSWQCQRAHIFQHITGCSLISRQDGVTTAWVCGVCQRNLKLRCV